MAEQELTEAEKALIHRELPSNLEQDDIVYLVYRKKEVGSQQLPNTGSKELGLVGLGFATAALAVLVFSKKRPNKIAGILLLVHLEVATSFLRLFKLLKIRSYNLIIRHSLHVVKKI